MKANKNNMMIIRRNEIIFKLNTLAMNTNYNSNTTTTGNTNSVSGT